jgi:putative FmdB family regulatory protein
MPIYAYKCGSCGHAKDVLQRMADDPLTDCPACGKPTFSKQLTAAGFQLKGSGWYATDFKGGSGGTSVPAAATGAADTAPSGDSTAASSGSNSSVDSASSSTATSAASGGCVTGCACH